MADYIVYARKWWLNAHGLADHLSDWHSNSRTIESVTKGDTLWVVGLRSSKKNESRWSLLGELRVAQVSTLKSDENKFGRVRIVPDPGESRVFAPEGQRDLASVLRGLAFESNRNIDAEGRQIGNCLQGPRKITADDVRRIKEHARQR